MKTADYSLQAFARILFLGFVFSLSFSSPPHLYLFIFLFSLFLVFSHIILPSPSFSLSSRKMVRDLHLVWQARNAFLLLGVREISPLITAVQVFPCCSNIALVPPADCYVKTSRAYRWQCMTEVCSVECDGAVTRVFSTCAAITTKTGILRLHLDDL